MTGIDSETSQDIAEAISLKGGRYLEAQIQGSKSQAQDGTLVVLVAGDRSLFDDCQSCFQVRRLTESYSLSNSPCCNLSSFSSQHSRHSMHHDILLHYVRL